MLTWAGRYVHTQACIHTHTHTHTRTQTVTSRKQPPQEALCSISGTHPKDLRSKGYYPMVYTGRWSSETPSHVPTPGSQCLWCQNKDFTSKFDRFSTQACKHGCLGCSVRTSFQKRTDFPFFCLAPRSTHYLSQLARASRKTPPLSEVSQTEKNKCHSILLILGTQNHGTNEFITKQK